MYRAYDITIRKEDRTKVDAILEQYDVDDITYSEEKHSDGSVTITYWIRPYLSIDIDDIVNGLKQNGIQIF